MWDDRISLVRAFADAITDRDVEWALELCHREVEFFLPDGAARREPVPRLRRHSQVLQGCRRDLRRMACRGRAAGVRAGQARRDRHVHAHAGQVERTPTHTVANLWEFRDEKLWRATLYRDPAEAVRAIDTRMAARPTKPAVLEVVGGWLLDCRRWRPDDRSGLLWAVCPRDVSTRCRGCSRLAAGEASGEGERVAAARHPYPGHSGPLTARAAAAHTSISRVGRVHIRSSRSAPARRHCQGLPGALHRRHQPAVRP